MFYILLVFFVLLLSFGIAAWSMAPWVPAWKKDLPRIFKLAELKPDEIFYDLGCGNGKLVFYASEKYKAQGYGVELALPMYLVCKIRQFFKRTPNVHFKFGNMFHTDISKADVIYVFGMPKKLDEKLSQKLKDDLKPGTRVISYVFKFNNLQLDKVDKPTKNDVSIYRYRI